MVDIHSHIVYGVDDGAQTLEESIAILVEAASGGTTDIVATPHANLEYSFDPDTVQSRLDQLRQVNPTNIRIFSGCELHLDFDLLQDAIQNPRKYSINSGAYILVELSERNSLADVPPIMDRLMRLGLIPILAHPERYFILRDQVDAIQALVEQGCLMQLTSQSIMGKFGSGIRKVSQRLLDLQLIHFIASDAHDTRMRNAGLGGCRQLVADEYGEGWAAILLDANPRATLNSGPLTLLPQRSRKSGSWFSFWK